MFSKRKRRFAWAVAAMVGVLAVAGGIAYAAIPGSDGVIHGCYLKGAGILRVIDSTSEDCKSIEMPIAWNQTGPPGPAGADGKDGRDGADGAPGSAAGYARISGAGVVEAAQSQNVTQANVTHPGPGLYCIGGLSFTPRAAVASGLSSIDAAGNPTNVDTLATVTVAIPDVTFPFGCAETDQVRIRTIGAFDSSGLVDRAFFVWLED